MRLRSLATIFLLTHGGDALAQQRPAPVARAAALEGEVRVDGRLDEAAWARAEAITGFTESYPEAGTPASERTEARVLYDGSALYVGVRLYDSSPDSIAAPLARRDAAGIYSDWVHVMLDSYHDRRTAFRFSANPRGVQRDVYVSNDADEDGSWDAVWQVATQIDSLGWTAEYRIPLSQLRFGAADEDGERVWGLQIMRDVARREQRFSWAPWDRKSPGVVSWFGELHGLVGIHSVRRVELQPYASARLTRAPIDAGNPFYEANSAGAALGGDFKVGLSSGLTLTGTVNPDFGQVELDPAEVNLSAFESFFSERRPFFVEGADVFRFGQVRSNMNIQGQTFFYSRRIGRAPQRSVGGPEVVHVDAPVETTILGAAKVTGKVGPWTVGLMDAVTDREQATFVTPEGAFVATPVEPRTNYFLSRVRRDLRDGRTVVGSMLSATHRDLDGEVFDGLLRSQAYFGGVDFEHSWADRAWTLSGYLAGSHLAGSQEAIARAQRAPARYFQRPDAGHLDLDPTRTSLQGHIGQVALMHSGSWDFTLGYKESSPGFEINDLGFQGRTDYRDVNAFLGRRVDRPGKIFRDRAVYGFGAAEWNFDGDAVFALVGGGANGTFNNLWSAGLEGNVQPSTYDDRLTWGGPLARNPLTWNTSGWFNSPSRNRVSFSGNAGLSGNEAGGHNRWLGVSVDWRPSSAARVQVGPNLSWSERVAQYVTAANDPAATATFGRRYVFATVEQTTLSMSTRVDWTFRPNLSLQLYAQPFVAAGSYDDFKELRAARTHDFASYGADRGTLCALESGLVVVDPVAQRACPATEPAADDPHFSLRFRDPDFNIRSLRGNAVLRWEYRPGSALFLVWQQQRSGAFGAGDFQLRRDLDGLLEAPPTNLFLIKATYWIGG